MQPRSALAVAFWWMSLVFCASASGIQVDFVAKAPYIRFNLLAAKYELFLDLNITKNASQFGQVIELKVKAEQGLFNRKVAILARVSKSGTQGYLVLRCRIYARCKKIKERIQARPSRYQQAIEFQAIVEFKPVRSAVTPAGMPTSVVFQRRFDNSVSFAQNWRTYALGFGDAAGEYWMGLERLSTITASGSCALSVEAVDFNGTVRRSRFETFKVKSAANNFELVLSGDDSRNEIGNPMFPASVMFSTFDRDNDMASGSCSKTFSRVGWWFGMAWCHYVLLNAPIGLTDSQCLLSGNFSYGTLRGGGRVCFKRTQMSLTCGG